ncbi:MAG TPA: UbiA family prenyltransferase [Pirellulales bacterium]
MASEHEAGRFKRIDADEEARSEALRPHIDSGVGATPHFKHVAWRALAFSRVAAPSSQGGAGAPAGATTLDKPAVPVGLVDLDGTLIASDAGAELLLVAARSRPMLAVKFVCWLIFQGRAVAERKLTAALPVDLRPLPGTHPAAVVAVPGGSSMAARLRVLRPKQWVKNLLLFVPLLLAHQVGDFGRLWKCCLSFIAFSAIASAIYVVNDLADLAADRLHPHKRRRPFAAGALPLREGPWLAGLLLAAGLGISLAALPAGLTGLMVLYLALTLLYSFWLKRKIVVDVIFLAAFYTLRVIAGGVATGVVVSEWLLVFSMFLFLSLAFAKRYVELARACDSGTMDLNRRSYLPSDLGLIESLGPNSGYLAVLVLALYVNSDHTRQLYPRAWLLWLLCPLLLYWITRIWFLAQRRSLSEDPVTHAVHDTVSWATAAGAMVIVLAAAAA